ncbi:MAG: hypothetical protein ABEH77_04110 [Halobacteriaceae archaeon]
MGNTAAAGGRSLAPFVRAHAAAARALPEPGEPYRRTDLDIDEAAFQGFRDRGVIRRVDTVVVTEGSRHRVARYETDQSAYERIQAIIPEGPWPDCPHTGLRNLGDGTFTCGHDGCEQRYDRATAAEVFA